jgi:hexosaminidase
MKGYSGGALITAKNGYNTVLSNGYYIDLMLSVDSHYLNDPVVLSPEEKREYWEGGCYVEQLEHRFKNMAQNCTCERLWSNDTLLT